MKHNNPKEEPMLEYYAGIDLHANNVAVESIFN
jgi:hypothetical protein